MHKHENPKNELIAVTKDIYDITNKRFPRGAINGVNEKGITFSVEKQKRYQDHSIELVVKAEKEFLADQAFESIKDKSRYLENNPDFRKRLVKIAQQMAKTYKSGTASDMARFAYDYAMTKYPGISVAHIQIKNPKNWSDNYHEIIVVGLSEAQLKSFLEKKFTECKSAVVLDIWDKQRYYAKHTASRLKKLAQKHQKGIFSGIEFNNPDDYILECAAYSPGVIKDNEATIESSNKDNIQSETSCHKEIDCVEEENKVNPEDSDIVSVDSEARSLSW